MAILIVIVTILTCAAGFVLFRRLEVPRLPPLPRSEASPAAGRLSVIIPARNEEGNLPHLLASLAAQRFRPHEIIVVNDHSEDDTRAIAERYGVIVVDNPPLPPGWTGKNWAVWNGYKRATGDVIAFLDADVRLSPEALEALVAERERCGGALSVVPYHHTERFYERLALIPNILGIFAFTSPFERTNPQKGLYGSCILTSRADYERAQGHEAVKAELLDDLNLGAKFREAGLPVTTFIGHGLVSFRMYPGGIRSEVQGFGKGAVLSTGKLKGGTIACVAAWLIGLIVAEAAPFCLWTPWAWAWLAGYVLYTLQIFYFVKYAGRFGRIMPVLHLISTVFFLFVMVYSLYRVVFVGKVVWKGRHIEVGGGRR